MRILVLHHITMFLVELHNHPCQPLRWQTERRCCSITNSFQFSTKDRVIGVERIKFESDAKRTIVGELEINFTEDRCRIDSITTVDHGNIFMIAQPIEGIFGKHGIFIHSVKTTTFILKDLTKEVSSLIEEFFSGGDPIGIVMFDEVFDKMDGNRMRAMMSFINSMPLQVIIACPPQRMDILQDYADTTLIMVRQGTKAKVLPMTNKEGALR